MASSSVSFYLLARRLEAWDGGSIIDVCRVVQDDTASTGLVISNLGIAGYIDHEVNAKPVHAPPQLRVMAKRPPAAVEGDTDNNQSTHVADAGQLR